MIHSRCRAIEQTQREEIAYLRGELEKAHTRIACMIDPMLEARRATALRVKLSAETEAAGGTPQPTKKSAILPHSASAVARLRGLASPLSPSTSPEEVEEMFKVKTPDEQAG